MKNTMKTILLMLMVSGLCFANSNIEPGALKEGTKTEKKPLTGVNALATEMKDSCVAQAREYAAGIEIDTSKAREFLLQEASKYGWSAEVVAEKVNAWIQEAEAKLNAALPIILQEMISELDSSLAKGIEKLSPQVEFQADYMYYENLPDENKWTRGGANIVGPSGVALSADATVGFAAGVAIGLSAEVDFKLFLSVKGNLSENGVNPFAEAAGTGRTIKMKGTPKFKVAVGGSVGGEAFLKLVIGAEITNSVKASDVSTTLSI